MTKEVSMQNVLTAIGVSQCELGRAVQISKSAAGRLVLDNAWPKRERHLLRRRVADYLGTRGASAEQLAAVEACAAQAEAAEKKTAPASSQLAEAGTPTTQGNEQQEDYMLLRKESLSTQAKDHFGLPRSPFENDIATRADVFAWPAARRARAALMDAALNNGFIALIGESGSGKSTLVEELEQRVLDEGQPILFIRPYVLETDRNDQKGKTMKSGQIIEAIIATLAPGTAIKSSAQARAKQAHELLAGSASAGYSHLIVIEEGQRLPIETTLRHLKSFLELKRGLRRLLGVAIIGQTELRTMLSETNPTVREVVQRCEKVEMQPLDNDLEAYIKHKFERMGLKVGEIFSDDAMDAIRARLVKIPRDGKAADGVSQCFPQVVNNLVCRAMNAAAAVKYPRVDAQVIAGC
jgi:type II secretory pathway predicted ATPase ExeA